jgi:hypothetical protein
MMPTSSEQARTSQQEILSSLPFDPRSYLCWVLLERPTVRMTRMSEIVSKTLTRADVVLSTVNSKGSQNVADIEKYGLDTQLDWTDTGYRFSILTTDQLPRDFINIERGPKR